MIIGEATSFALESEISSAYTRPSLRALGFFVIHLNSVTYGVRSSEATLLACSVDEVENRLRNRGRHVAPFSGEADAGALADAVAKALYGNDDATQRYLGLSSEEFVALLHTNDIVWAPDGDEAFDDGSCVIQFDQADRVRIIGFKYDDAHCHIQRTLQEIWIDADRFYDVLERWRSAFEAEWRAAPKVSAS